MVRVLLLFLLVVSGNLNAQVFENTGFAYVDRTPVYRVPGLLAASATYTPGISLNRDQTNFYLNGFAEYHINYSVSVKSDSYWFLNTPDIENEELKMLRSHFGLYYHLRRFPMTNSDFKIGFLPGILLSNGIAEEDVYSVSPSIQLALGYDFYVWKYFHFFSQISYVHSTLRSAPVGLKERDELLISVGLGFQIPTRGWKKRKTSME